MLYHIVQKHLKILQQSLTCWISKKKVPTIVKGKAKNIRATFKFISRNKLTTLWLKKEKTNIQRIIHRTQHRKTNPEQHEPQQNWG